MEKPGLIRRVIARFGRGIGLIFILIGIPLFIAGLILLLIPLIGWVFAIPLLVVGAFVTFLGILIAAKTAIHHRHLHTGHSHAHEKNEEVEVKGNLVCYRCGAYISEKDLICPNCGAKQ
ncbi:hypothetical protein HYV81_05295 [Candidatus Woesearchaeota archaeon]|nr:hypothetical protein [Candidatus Woesearchaeota archaeon]